MSIPIGKEKKGNYSRKFPFSSKLYCGFCGTVLTRRNWLSGTKHQVRVWHCMKFVKEGKEYCPHCKAMKEEIIETCFIEMHRLLCTEKKQIIDTFFERLDSFSNKSAIQSKMESTEKEIQKLKQKIQRLLDLSLEDSIDKETYLDKKVKLQNKMSALIKEKEHLILEIEDEQNLDMGTDKFKKQFESSQIMERFDKDVFEVLIRKVIIGEETD